MHMHVEYALKTKTTYTAVQPLRNCCRKFGEIRATRWLLWHSDFTEFKISTGASPRTRLGELTTLPRPLVLSLRQKRVNRVRSASLIDRLNDRLRYNNDALNV